LPASPLIRNRYLYVFVCSSKNEIMKLILCAVDFSPASINSARYAAGLSIALEAKIILVHVYEPPVMYMDVPMTDLRDADGLLLEAVEKKVQSLGIKLMKEFKGLRCEARLLKGIAAEQIVGICGKQNADLLVIGSTGGSRLIRMLMGSTSSRLIRETNCPVLCVPGKAEFNDILQPIFMKTISSQP